jgi:hypothetical protein
MGDLRGAEAQDDVLGIDLWMLEGCRAERKGKGPRQAYLVGEHRGSSSLQIFQPSIGAFGGEKKSDHEKFKMSNR